ncbi:amino acid ABC transporter membrane protein 1 (PAAT family) [Paraburkholderia caballeronis]|uniref:amino acid ABC transporter permease n=1 Tax=Paraburkholderia caballeronis TaxID=416943 RepID=UPI001065411C|nr:amino acid ABC transporter permease [Paraburkholderia caballeronis]TDV33853.1 amino acid ABC transporter membrane protein 1 (PAAT family) [Paraburkholderia caballeronis]
MSYQFDFSFLSQYWPDLLRGVWWTVRMALLAMVPGFVAGVALAIGRIHGSAVVLRMIGAYIEIIRNTPLVLQVFWIFFGLAAIRFHVAALVAAIVALVINVSAYTAEIMRAGLESIHGGQIEAASCLALTRRQVLWYIEIPQAVEKMYPALVSQFILMMLATSIMSQISAEELTGVADLIQSFTFRGFEAYAVIAILYLMLASALRWVLLAAGAWLFPRLKAGVAAGGRK